MEQTIDSVAMMRELRDRLHEELMAIPPEEHPRLLRERAAATPLGVRLQKQSGRLDDHTAQSKITESR